MTSRISLYILFLLISLHSTTVLAHTDENIATALSVTTQTITLTEQEKLFIKKHPVIVLGGGSSFEPFLIQNDNGTITGHDYELVQLISKQTGLKFRFELGNWKEIQTKADNYEIDGLSSAGFAQKRLELFNPSNNYLNFTSRIFVTSGNPKRLLRAEDLAGKRVALQRSNILFEQIISSLIHDAQIVWYDTIDELLIALANNHVDYTILDESAFYLINKLGLSGLIESAFPLGKPFNIMFWFRNDWPELPSIINKGLNNIPELEKVILRKRWFGNHLQQSSIQNTISLSILEQQYLAKKEKLNLCVDPNWHPFESIDIKGNYSGMGSDFLPLISQRLGIEVDIYPTKNWSDTLDALRNRRCDMVSLIQPTADRTVYLDFTTEIFEFPYVIATTNEQFYIEDFDQLLDKTFAVSLDHAAVNSLRDHYPQIKLVEVNSVEEGLRQVQQGKTFGYIGATAAIATSRMQNQLTNIKIAGQLPFDFKLSFASRNDEPLLKDILQKAVNTLSDEDKKRVYTKWVAVDIERAIDKTLLWQVVAATATIIALFIYWNRKLTYSNQQTVLALEKLKKTRKRLEKQNTQLQKISVTDPLTQLYNRLKLDKELKEEVLRCARYQNSFGVIMIDIDHFKRVNDQHGHLVGDQVISSIARVLEKHIREIDTLGRWGGEEFLIICPESTLDGLRQLAERLRSAIEREELPIVEHKTASFGAAIFEPEDSVETIIAKADNALYRAKDQGRNQVVLYYNNSL